MFSFCCHISSDLKVTCEMSPSNCCPYSRDNEGKQSDDNYGETILRDFVRKLNRRRKA